MNESENLKNDDQLLEMMEEMQDQIERVQTELQKEQAKNLEAQKVISKISSENSILNAGSIHEWTDHRHVRRDT